MRKKIIYQLIDYDLWANELILDALQIADSPEERAFALASHVLIISNTWLNRITGKEITLSPWDLLNAKERKNLLANNQDGWMHYIKNLKEENFSTPMQFLFQGKDVFMTIEELWMHIVNHSSYHRGQIVTLLKGKIDPLPFTNFIGFASHL